MELLRDVEHYHEILMCLDDSQQLPGEHFLVRLAVSQRNSPGSYIILCGHWAIYNRCLIPVEAHKGCLRSEWIRHLHLLLLVVMVLSAVPCRRVLRSFKHQHGIQWEI